MDSKEISFTSQCLEHLKEPIIGLCLNLKCKDKTQFCNKCLMNKHLDHKERDCKTIYEIQQMTQNDIGQMPKQIELANQIFRKVEKAHEGFTKLILGERDYLIELKKNLKTSNYYLYKKDFLRLKKLNIVIRKMLSPKCKNFFLGILKVMNKIQETLDNLSESKLNERKQVIKNVELNVNFEQIVQLDVIFNNQMIICCENEQCYDKQQCCEKCYMKNNKEIFNSRVIMNRIEMQIIIINQYQFAVETYFKDGRQLYKLFKLFLEKQEILLKNMDYPLGINDLMLYLKKQKKWVKLKEMNFNNEYNNILSNILDKLIQLSKTISKQIKVDVKQVMQREQSENIKQDKSINESIDLENKSEELLNQESLRRCYFFVQLMIKINPKHYLAIYNKGIALRDQSLQEDAICCQEQAIKINPNFSEAYYNKGLALNNLNRHDEAILSFDQAIKINPNYSEAYINKGFQKGVRVSSSFKNFQMRQVTFDFFVPAGQAFFVFILFEKKLTGFLRQDMMKNSLYHFIYSSVVQQCIQHQEKFSMINIEIRPEAIKQKIQSKLRFNYDHQFYIQAMPSRKYEQKIKYHQYRT